MIRGLSALLLAALVVVGGQDAGAAATGATGQVQLSTNVIAPGEQVVISGSGWRPGTSLDVTLCGANAVSGFVDCAATATATLVATARGLVWSELTGALPPKPCPCVALVTGNGTSYTKTLPVQIVGQPTSPVRTTAPAPGPELRLSRLYVSGSATAASVFGGAVRRTLEVRVTNPGDQPATPVLVGRWGRPGDLVNVITMPVQHALSPGQSRTVRVGFTLGALSVGSYQVSVRAQVAAYPFERVVTATTSQWPVALLACGAVVVLMILLLIVRGLVRRLRRRRSRRPRPMSASPLPGDEPAGDEAA